MRCVIYKLVSSSPSSTVLLQNSIFNHFRARETPRVALFAVNLNNYYRYLCTERLVPREPCLSRKKRHLDSLLCRSSSSSSRKLSHSVVKMIFFLFRISRCICMRNKTNVIITLIEICQNLRRLKFKREYVIATWKVTVRSRKRFQFEI